MGVLKSIADKLGVWEKRTTLRTVTVRVKMDCEGCERKVRKALSSMKGAHAVSVDRGQQRADITGYVEPKHVLRRLAAAGKKAELWPFVPAYLVTQPYAVGAYDRKAPAGHVRNVEDHPGHENSRGYTISQAFSDDDPNSCSIM